MDIRAKLKEMGLELPAVTAPQAAYVPAVRAGNLLYVSGQVPFVDGEVKWTGPVPSKVDFGEAQLAARQCALNALAVVDDAIDGDWSTFDRIVRIGGWVHSDPGFDQQHKVINGASEFLGEVLGEAGQHARAAVGAVALPLGSTVEVEMIVALR